MPILDAAGNPFYTGLIAPQPGFVSAYPKAADAIGLYTDAQIQDIINDPDRTPKSQVFDDHWIIEGDQKQHNSCAGWGGNNAMSKTFFLRGDTSGTVYSGAYTYSWVNRGQDEGAVLEDVMNELMNHGTVAASVCGANNIWRADCAKFDSQAANIKGVDLFAVKSQAEVNTALAKDLIVVVCVQVDSSQYCNYKGSGLVPAFNGSGNHCIHVDDIRYVNGQYQYRQVGNWGLGWGSKGTGWCTWASFKQTILNHTFYVLTSSENLAA